MTHKTKKHNYGLVIGIIGLMLTILSWFFEQSQEMDWISKSISPSYARATYAYENILAKGKGLTPLDIGFGEIFATVQDFMDETRDSAIAEIRITDQGFSFLPSSTGNEATPGITIEIKHNDGRAATSIFMKEIPSTLKRKYLDHKLFIYRTIIFWLGIVVISVGLFKRNNDPKSTAA
jgi:hypothetical protein